MKRLTILGQIPFDDIGKTELFKLIIELISTRQKSLISNMNTYGVVMFLKNQKYREIISSSDIIYPDGWGPVVASWVEKRHLKERLNVGDFISPLLKMVQVLGFKVYFVGGDKTLVLRTQLAVKNNYPNLKIAGFRSGYFTDFERTKMVKDIASKKPNLILVGMGIPEQEYFIKDNWKDLPPAVYMGVGGVFHYLSGTKKRAPKWMRNYGMEWLFRLFQEPVRLWKRYTLDNLFFLYFVIKNLFTTRFKKNFGRSFPNGS